MTHFILDTVEYTLTHGEFRARLNVIGIDSVTCRTDTNVDFVHFFWENFEQFSCTRYSITPLPPHVDPSSRPQTLNLAHHKGESNGWRHQNGCTMCSSEYLVIVRPPPTTAHSPADSVNASSADTNTPPLPLPPTSPSFDLHST